MRPLVALLALPLLSSACITRIIETDDAGNTTMLTVGDGSDDSDPTAPTTPSDTQLPTTAMTIPGGTEDPTSDATSDPTNGPTSVTTDPGNDSALCTNFGHFPGIQAMIDSFLAKVLVDDRINAYFLTSDLDGAHLRDCLAEQVGNAVGCESVIYTCQDMKTAHAGMGISTQDFNDLAMDFSLAMDEVPTLTIDDKQTVLAVLGSMAPDIVEDFDNNVTAYQRIGRKPGIGTIIGSPVEPESFIALVAGDATLLPFFAPTDLERFTTCLARQLITATGGPLIYGKEVTAPAPADPGVASDNPCLDMVTSHKDLKDGMNVGIEFADFGALVGHLVIAMDSAGVSMADQNAIAGSLGPLCSSIVTVDPAQCP